MLIVTCSKQVAKYALMIVSTIVILFYAKQKSTNDVTLFVTHMENNTATFIVRKNNIKESPKPKSTNDVPLVVNKTQNNTTIANVRNSKKIQDSSKTKSTKEVSLFVNNATTSNTTTAIVMNNQVQDLPKPKSTNDVSLIVDNTMKQNIVRNNVVPKVLPSCRRKCVHQHRNIIIYSNIWQAGLNDREYMRTYLANFAGYLCATVYMSSPHVMLSPKHNNKRLVSKQLQWDDFSIIKWIDEDTSVFGTLYNDSTNELIDRPKLEHFHNVLNGTTTIKNWLKIRTNVTWDGFDQQLNQIEQFIIDHPERGFILELTGSYYYARDIISNWKRLPSLDNTTSRNWTTTNAIIRTRKEKNCNYFDRLTPPLMEEIVQRIWTDLYKIPSTPPDGGIIFFHVRHTDTIHECNTTIAKIQSFLNCSLSNRHEFGTLRVIVPIGNIVIRYKRILPISLTIL